jgi:HD-GYP domain-containing protein (c-di-GMP phosphodiesterase class II)
MADPIIEQATSHLAGQDQEHLLIAFFALYKMARLVDRTNKTFTDKRDDFYRRLQAELDRDGEAALKVHHNRYFVNDKMVRLSRDTLAGAEAVVGEWTSLGIGGIRFSGDITPDEIDTFFEAITSARVTEQNRDDLAQRLLSLGLAAIELLGTTELDQPEEAPEDRRQQFRRMARTSFFRAISTVQDVMASAADDKEINVSKTKRVVHSLIDRIIEDESSVMELTAIKNFDDYTYAHSTNVCIYSLTIGVRIGFDRVRLSELGFAALFHDVGKVRLPKDLIRKPGAYDENDWAQMQRHPLLGSKTILRNMELNPHTARAARGAFEHHINMDFTGYPQLRYDRREPNLFSRIIAIADTFDALTSGRVYIKKAIPADEVVRKMRFQMKVKFDPVLLRIFIDAVGVYPSGSLVLLSTHQLAIVLTQNETDKNRPYLKIVGDRDGLYTSPAWADLSEPQFADCRIIHIVEPEKYGLDLQSFILQD